MPIGEIKNFRSANFGIFRRVSALIISELRLIISIFIANFVTIKIIVHE